MVSDKSLTLVDSKLEAPSVKIKDFRDSPESKFHFLSLNLSINDLGFDFGLGLGIFN